MPPTKEINMRKAKFRCVAGGTCKSRWVEDRFGHVDFYLPLRKHSRLNSTEMTFKKASFDSWVGHV